MAWIVMLLLACGTDTDKVNGAAQAAAGQEAAAKLAQDEAREREQIERQEKRRAQVAKLIAARKAEGATVRSELGVAPEGKLSAVFVTSMGKIQCDLLVDAAPQTVLNFVQLAEGSKDWTDPKTKKASKKPLYSGTIFHRVIPRFMIQGGDPLGSGRGGPGYRFADEPHPEYGFDRPGLLAMANSGPNTNGSQFFITDRAKPSHLNNKHTIFGVCENLDVVEAIATTPTKPGDRPVEDVVLNRVRIVR
jgi:peptidyl-prolyl cis-trans isomerase A (cyclophilin A)